MKDELREIEIFKNLKDETIESLCEICNVREIKKGEQLFYDKYKVNTIFILLSGKAVLYKISEKAQKKIIFILGKGSILNDVILDDLPASINCEVFEDAEVLCFQKDSFIRVMEKDFSLTKEVVNSLAKKVRRLYRQLKNSTPIKVEKRVAAKLWKLAKDYGINKESGTEINLKISITYLADMFGTQRETISRALKVLQDKELIVIKNKKFVVKDLDDLAKFFKK
ncbi:MULTISPECIES: Crp/Fnr family transcriptional regulator [Clostridium]|uniref:Crp/Fnr family transcriptional regulator n=1 Tax=Clostridium cibarium TaxID=2762247 RepID=A0ABR8PU17_9CLOT|nr:MULTISPECIES: Crp/Fnr family transcriptional regulator [Clostridium]MBD7911656.1 Crp/Fnr family transcriptional regulator [Clostridium cibarium]